MAAINQVVINYSHWTFQWSDNLFDVIEYPVCHKGNQTTGLVSDFK